MTLHELFTTPGHLTVLSLSECREVNALCERGMWKDAALLVIPDPFWHLVPAGYDKESQAQAKEIVTWYFYWLLNKGKKLEAAHIAFSESIFHFKAKSTKIIWDYCENKQTFLVTAGAAMGKSYAAGIYYALDYASDPKATYIRVFAATESQAQVTLFGQIKRAYKNSIIDLPGKVVADRISVDSTDETCGIHLWTVSKGEKGHTPLKGIHPLPRLTPHPVYGSHSRIRIIIDEAGDVAEGVWGSIANLLTTVDKSAAYPLTIQICGFFNPEDSTHSIAKRVTPPGGLEAYDIDGGVDEWVSTTGWSVYRIDPIKTENIINKRVVIPGMQTYDGLQQIIQKNGVGSRDYYVQARGWFPKVGDEQAIIPPHLVTDSYGIVIYDEKPQQCVSIDTALQGGDRTILTYASYGLANKVRIKKGGEEKIVKLWEDKKVVIQIDSQVELPIKGNSLQIANAIIMTLPPKELQPPEFIAVDATGVGDGVASILQDRLGDILTINYSWTPSDLRMVDGDELTARQRFTNQATELWYGGKIYFENQRLWLNPELHGTSLIEELTTRRAKTTSRKSQVESKKEWRNRLTAAGSVVKSPDRADSLLQIVQLVRERGEWEISFTGDRAYTGIDNMVSYNIPIQGNFDYDEG